MKGINQFVPIDQGWMLTLNHFTKASKEGPIYLHKPTGLFAKTILKDIGTTTSVSQPILINQKKT